MQLLHPLTLPQVARSSRGSAYLALFPLDEERWRLMQGTRSTQKITRMFLLPMWGVLFSTNSKHIPHLPPTQFSFSQCTPTLLQVKCLKHPQPFKTTQPSEVHMCQMPIRCLCRQKYSNRLLQEEEPVQGHGYIIWWGGGGGLKCRKSVFFPSRIFLIQKFGNLEKYHKHLLWFFFPSFWNGQKTALRKSFAHAKCTTWIFFYIRQSLTLDNDNFLCKQHTQLIWQ